MEVESLEREKRATFTYTFSSNGTRYQLRVPVRGPLSAVRARELASRVISAHNLPCYLEDELCSQLEAFARDTALREWDCEGDELVKLAGTTESAEVGKGIDQCVERFTKNCSEFSVATVTHDNKPTFSDMYHTLIHSPALDTLLQLEHTYALAMENSLQAWKNARDVMSKRHNAELREKMAEVSAARAREEDLASLMREHERDRTVLEVQWRGELTNLRETQRSSYQQWIDGTYKEMTSPGSVKSSHFIQSKRGMGEGGDDDVFSGVGDEGGEGEPSHGSPLEESFTIHLGAQLKSTHNIRLLCGDPLSLCHKRRGGVRGGLDPERLQTAMSLYSTKLMCMILTVERNIGQPTGMERKFSDICHQTTDLHFSDYSDQMAVVLDAVASANDSRSRAGQLCVLESSSSSQTSEPSTPRGESPFHHQPERAVRGVTDSDSSSPHSLLSPPPPPTPLTAPSTSGSGRSLGGNGGDPVSEQDMPSLLLETGDFFITRHSNLSQVHVVLHLATDREAIKDPGLRARHPVMAGLKNCLHVAARNDVHHITVPLLLVHQMEPEMTINWCLKRAELVFKCVKGFMLENPLWGNGDSRTIQFLIPQSISQDLFEEFCEMLPKVFRVSTTRKLTTRTSRTHSYK